MNTNSSTPAASTLASSINAALANAVTEGANAPSAARSIDTSARIAVSFITQSTDSVFAGLTAHIIVALTGNTTFPDTSPKLDVVIATRERYVDAVTALDRSRSSLAVRDAARADAEQVFRDLALYLQHASGGDRVKLTGTGFPLHKSRRPAVGLPSVPANVRLRRTRVSTQLLALCDRVPSARSYQWRYAPAQAPTAWIQPDPISRARFVLEDLLPGTAYIVQVRAFSTRGAGDWSDSVMMIAA